MPLFVLAIMGWRQQQVTMSSEIVLSSFYLINPMFTFYLTNYLQVIDFVNVYYNNTGTEFYIPLVKGWKVTYRNSLICYCV
jgi:hypothetical protein